MVDFALGLSQESEWKMCDITKANSKLALIRFEWLKTFSKNSL